MTGRRRPCEQILIIITYQYMSPVKTSTYMTDTIEEESMQIRFVLANLSRFHEL